MIFESVFGGAGRCQGECGHYFGGACLLGTWRCETFLSQSRDSWEPINPNDPATLQTQAPLYGPDICPNGQNLKTQRGFGCLDFCWWFWWFRLWRFFVSDKMTQQSHQPWFPWNLTESPLNGMEEHEDVVKFGQMDTHKWCFDKGFDNGLKGILGGFKHVF